MKLPFVQPRFTGSRFDEHTLPVDVVSDLAAYEGLVVELAKHLYLKEHPDRQRVPKGFAAHFRLDIENIEAGSARPRLCLMFASATMVLDAQAHQPTVFEKARDLIAECVAAEVHALPKDFPKSLLRHFNQIGRSLHEDEALELPIPNSIAPARLTPQKRKQLVLAASQVYEREVVLQGYIEELDFKKYSFRLRMDDDRTAIIPMLGNFEDTARACLGYSRHMVTVTGVGVHDAHDELERMKSIHSVDVFKNWPIALRFEELAQLDDGWCEGLGKGMDINMLMVLSDKMTLNYPEVLPLPAIAPTQDGGILLEWNAEGMPSLDISPDGKMASYHAFKNETENIEGDFLLDEQGWCDLFGFLKENIKEQNQ